jgi:fructokinase
MMAPRIVALGEVLWDLLPTGRMLGGAPANFAFHARALGAEAHLISRVGDDELGQEIVRRLTAKAIPVEDVQVDPVAPTGTVSVELNGDGQPFYVIHERTAWDAIAVTPEALALVAGADAVCFGSLGQRSKVSRESIRALVATAPAQVLRIFDINLRQKYFTRDTIEVSLELANVLKLNDAELPVLEEMFGLGGEAQEQIVALAHRFSLRAVALTLGGRGSLLLVDGVLSDHAGVQTEVRDTIGAGDAFTAVLCLGLLAGWEPDRINERANRVAAFVCSQAGATPELPEDLRGMG